MGRYRFQFIVPLWLQEGSISLAKPQPVCSAMVLILPESPLCPQHPPLVQSILCFEAQNGFLAVIVRSLCMFH